MCKLFLLVLSTLNIAQIPLKNISHALVFHFLMLHEEKSSCNSGFLIFPFKYLIQRSVQEHGVLFPYAFLNYVICAIAWHSVPPENFCFNFIHCAAFL